MKKNYVRLLAMLVCFVMVLAMVPANANAVALQNKKMPQMKTITYDEDYMAHFITEPGDLAHIAGVAANDPNNYYECIYESDTPFTITQNITIPNNMSFNCWSDILIPANITVTVEGSMSGQAITINGTLNIGEYGSVYTGYALANNGAINLNGSLGISVYTDVTGNPINYMDYGYVNMSCYFENSAQLQEIADMAAACALPWKFTAGASNEVINLTSPIELPGNVNLQFYYPDSKISGATITVNGELYVDGNGQCVIKNNLVINGPSYIYTWDQEEGQNSSVTFEGAITNNEYMEIYGKVNFKNTVVNNYRMDVWYEHGAALTFANANLYSDSNGAGILWVNSSLSYFPNDAIAGLNVNDFKTINKWDDLFIPYWSLTDYANSAPVPPVHEHTPMTMPAVPATCLMNGMSEWVMCATCNETLVEAHELAPLGHDYGLAADGKTIDFYDTTCDVCGAERIVNPTRLTHSMYRMYNPNTGEHFYTGDKGERQTLEAAGWKFEGVGFTFPANTGAPVYRLFQPATGEHLYTMSEVEVETLISQGWNMEGIAFNSATSSEVAQYRLYNPNVNVGAYHFTSSTEEKAVLLAAGWQDQGIGFYTCWQ